MPRLGDVWRCVTLALVAWTMTLSCAHDPAWGRQERAQAAMARRVAPTALRATPEREGAPPGADGRVLRLRAYVTPRYTAEVMDWRARLDELVGDANAVLAPTLRIRLAVAEAKLWSPRSDEDDLGVLADELKTLDPGTDVDWVAGFSASVPRVEVSFHQLGLAMMPGKHFVLRAVNDAREFDAIQSLLSELDERARTDLYRARRRHKSTAMLLHELGHTLGAPHERDAGSVMSPSYDARVAGYGPAAASLMRLALRHRLAPERPSADSLASAFITEIEATSSAWIAEERDALLARLRARRSPAPSNAASAPVAVDAETALLRTEDQPAFVRARADVKAGRLREAREAGEPLFAAYGDLYAVQDLRCSIAMRMGGSLAFIEAECGPLMRIVKAQAKAGREKRP